MFGLDRETRRKETQDVKDWFASTPGMAVLAITAILLVWSIVSGML